GGGGEGKRRGGRKGGGGGGGGGGGRGGGPGRGGGGGLGKGGPGAGGRNGGPPRGPRRCRMRKAAPRRGPVQPSTGPGPPPVRCLSPAGRAGSEPPSNSSRNALGNWHRCDWRLRATHWRGS